MHHHTMALTALTLNLKLEPLSALNCSSVQFSVTALLEPQSSIKLKTIRIAAHVKLCVFPLHPG